MICCYVDRDAFTIDSGAVTVGAGLERHIVDGYRYLVDTFSEGDEIYIVGFSRGAYTARSLVGMLRNCGLLKPGAGTGKILMAYGMYRTRDDGVDSKTAKIFRLKFSREVRVKFLGVWDTVGAMGIPLQVAGDLNAKFYGFHDTSLSAIVENAYHAVALDEHRVDYKACLWEPTEAHAQTLEQRWFCGAHSDVGGGYASRTLSDITLQWMQDMAVLSGLRLTRVSVADENFLGVITDSYGEFLHDESKKLKQRYFRPAMSVQFGNERLDESISNRRAAATMNPRYAPRNSGLPEL